MNDKSQPQRTPRTRPVSVVVIAVLLLAEALGVLYYALVYALQLGTPGPLSMGGRLFMLGLIVAAGIWQCSVAWNLFRGRAWTRAAAITWQLIQVIVAIPFFGVGGALTGTLLLLPAAAIIVLLFDPRTTAFFGDRQSGSTAARS
ncbi:hypothetical protein GCM10023166_10740 [Paeniglutamicibacter cryotolerans]